MQKVNDFGVCLCYSSGKFKSLFTKIAMTQTVTLHQQRRCESSNRLRVKHESLFRLPAVNVVLGHSRHSRIRSPLVAAKYLVRLLVFFGGSKIL